MVDAAIALAEARDLIRDNIGFGRWCDEARFRLNAHDRAALVAMGADPEQLSDVLRATERRSIQLIFKHEWIDRLASTSKTGMAEAVAEPELETVAGDVQKQNQREQHRQEREASQQRAREIREQQKQEQQERERLARRAEADARQRQKEAEQIERLKEIARERERMEARYQKQRADFKAAGGNPDDTREFLESIFRPNKGFPLTIDEWKQFSMCFHPDSTPSTEVKVKLMALWNNKKEALTGVKPAVID